MTRRFLVVHDYGTGGLWWWVWARSPEEIVETIAEVEVVTDPELVASVEADEVRLDDLSDETLIALRNQRSARGAGGIGRTGACGRSAPQKPDGAERTGDPELIGRMSGDLVGPASGGPCGPVDAPDG